MNPNLEIGKYLASRSKRINQVLSDFLNKQQNKYGDVKLLQAIKYSLLNGGKRIRPILVYATSESFNTPLEFLDAPAAAIELIHSCSLIHDDLPAMDNDAFRRGQPTCHKKFDEATAILAGDSLAILPFELLSQDTNIDSKNCNYCNYLMQLFEFAAKPSIELPVLQANYTISLCWNRDANERECINASK